MHRIDRDIHRRPLPSARAGQPRTGRRIHTATLLVVVLVTLVLALATCSSDGRTEQGSETTDRSAGTPQSTRPAAQPGPVRVVVLGSSTAAGFGLADPSEGWVAIYTAALKEADAANEVVNLAVSGNSTFHVLPTGSPVPEGRPTVDVDHNITAALARRPDAVIVNLPSNDAALGVPTGDQMDNLAALVAAANAADVPVWIGTTQPRSLDGAGRALLVEARDRILHEYGDRAVDLWTGIADDDGNLDAALDAGDGTHLNPKGHAIIAEAFLAADIPTLASSG